MQNNVLHKHTQPGISFIEILVVLLLISILMSTVMPRIFSYNPRRTYQTFFHDFAQLLSDTAYQAVMSKKTHQIFWDFKNKKITVKQYAPDDTEKNIAKQFKPLPKDVFHTQLDLPDYFTIANFIIQGKESLIPGAITNDAWFYVMKDGSCQATTINIGDSTQPEGTGFSIQINPFYSQATYHDEFSK